LHETGNVLETTLNQLYEGACMLPIIQSIDQVPSYFRCSEQRMCHEMSRRMQATCVMNLPYTVRRQKNKPV